MIPAKRLAPMLAALLLAAAPAAAQAQGAPAPERWTPLGPTGGTITALAVAPGVRRTLYAGTESGAVFRSEDAGAHWTYTGSDLTDVAVSDLEVDPRDPAAVYAASCEFNFEPPFRAGGVLKTTDGGRTWTLLDVGIDFECNPIDLAIDPHDPDTVFAASPSGLFETHDGGATWQLNPGMPDEVSRDAVAAVAFDPAAPGTLYILHSRLGVQKSTDGGASWTTVSAGLPAPGHLVGLELDPRAPGTLYVRTFDPAAAPAPGIAPVYRSADGGATWSPAADGLGGRRVLDLAAARASATLYAATGDGVFRSQDGGRHWTGAVPGTAGALVVAVPPSPAGIVYTGVSLRGVLKSFDRGANWRAVNRGLHGLAVFELALSPSNPAVLYATVHQIGVQRSDDGGATWQDANGGLEVEPLLLAVDPRQPRTAFAGHIGRLWKTTDGGASWRLVLGDETSCVLPQEIVFDPRRSRTIYTAGSHFSCTEAGSCLGFKSTDGGESWTCMEELARDVLALEIDPVRPAVLYAGGFNEVQATTDAGRNWNDATAGLPVVLVESLALALPGPLYAGTSHGLFRRAGGSWSRYLPELFDTRTNVTAAPSAPAILYAVAGHPGTTAGTRLFRSVDAGASWRRVTEQGLPAGHQIALIVVDPVRPRVLYTLARGGIYRLSRPPAPGS